MQIQRSGVVLAIVAAIAVIGVGAQAAGRSAALAPTPSESLSSSDIISAAPDLSAAPTETSQPSVEEPTPMPSDTPPAQTDFDKQWREQIEKTQAFAATLIGMNIDEAQKLAQEAGLVVRILVRDGEGFPATMDYRSDRVDVWVSKDIITKYSVG